MNIFVTIIDFLSLLVCVAILVFLFSLTKKFDRLTFVFLFLAILIVTFVSISNCIENVTQNNYLDTYEDYLEILFIPLMVFSMYSFSLNRELHKRKNAEEALKESTSRLKYALQGAGEGLWDWDVNTNDLYFSSEFYRILGYKPFSFVANRENWLKLIHPEQRANEEEFRNSFFTENPDAKSIELQLLTSQETYKWVILQGKTVEKNQDSSPARISGIILDISARKQIEEALILARDKAEESEKLKSAFLANMSHEIRTPLNGIIGFADLLQDDDVSKEKQYEYISYINQNSAILLSLINDIIEISKIEAGQLRPIFESFALNEMLEEIYVFYISTQTSKLKNLEFSFTSGLNDKESVILSDKTRLRQILNNLIDNALKNTDQGFVRFGYKKENHSELLFFVEDSGTGIDKKEQDIIFERFRQADSGRGIKKGSGLGLAICKGLVTMLNGKIWVESEPGKGSTFFFSTPYREVYDLRPKLSGMIENIEFDRYKILLVDDDPFSLQFLAEIVKNAGMQYIEASVGNDAIQKLNSNADVDLVLLDIQLPDIDGHLVLKKIRMINPDIPVIAQTAYASDHEKEKCLRSGFTDYITKPIIPMKLMQMIGSHLKKE